MTRTSFTCKSAHLDAADIRLAAEHAICGRSGCVRRMDIRAVGSALGPADHPVDCDPLETGSLPVGTGDVGEPVVGIMGHDIAKLRVGEVGPTEVSVPQVAAPDQGGPRRVRGRRRALTRGGARVGCQDRRRLPLCARGTGAPARPGRLIEGDPPRLEQRLALGAVCASTCTGTRGGDRLRYGYGA